MGEFTHLDNRRRSVMKVPTDQLHLSAYKALCKYLKLVQSNQSQMNFSE